MQITVIHREGMSFEGIAHPGHRVVMDASTAVGGENRGPKPGQMLLMALGGCTGMDVVSLLRKFGVAWKKFVIELEGEFNSEHPRYLKKVNLLYRFRTEGGEPEKFKLAVQKSMEKYSVVRHSLKAEVEWRVEVNGEIV